MPTAPFLAMLQCWIMTWILLINHTVGPAVLAIQKHVVCWLALLVVFLPIREKHTDSSGRACHKCYFRWYDKSHTDLAERGLRAQSSAGQKRGLAIWRTLGLSICVCFNFLRGGGVGH